MNEANGQFSDALKKIINSYGKELFGNTQKLNALLMDIAPNCGKERKLICQVIDGGIGEELLDASDKSEDIQRQCLTKCRRQLKNDTWIAEEAISYAFNVIVDAIGMTISDNNVPNDNSDCQGGKILFKGEFNGGTDGLTEFLSGYSLIGYKAFAAHTELKSIVIPETIISIGKKSFMNCINLEEIRLPKGIEFIGKEAFRGCCSLGRIVLADGKFFTVSGGMLINKREKSLIRAEKKNAVECGIPSGVTSVEAYAFEYSHAVNIKIPKSVNRLNSNAFVYCGALESFDVDISSSTLRSVEGVLYSRDMTRLIKYPSAKKSVSYILEDGARYIEERAFSDAENLESITFTSDIKSIGERAFENCIKLFSLVLPASVEFVGERAFQFCSSLSSIMLPRGIKEIGDYAFNGCTAIRSVSIPSSVNRIGHCAFLGCKQLKQLVIQENIGFIGTNAFAGCSTELEICIKNNNYAKAYCEAHKLNYKYI